jgi:hypothetical protein
MRASGPANAARPAGAGATGPAVAKPATAPAPRTPRAAVVDYAEKRRAEHHGRAWRNRWFFWLLQGSTIVAAGAATVLAVANWADPMVQALPAAIATLTAAFLGSFHPRTAANRHCKAEHMLRFELLKFDQSLLEYATERETATERFLARVEAISRAADEEFDTDALIDGDDRDGQG